MTEELKKSEISNICFVLGQFRLELSHLIDKIDEIALRVCYEKNWDCSDCESPEAKF